MKPLPPSANAAATLRRNQKLALLALAGMALGWGYNWVVMKSVLQYVGAFDFSALRNLAAALFLLGLQYFRGHSLRVYRWRRVLVLGLLQTGLFSLLVQVALLDGGAGKTAILVYTMPFWVVPMSWFAFGERVRGLQWLALALAAAGLVLILEPWSGGGGMFSKVLGVAAGFSWALATVAAKWARQDNPMELLPLTAWQMMFGALALCVAALLVPERPIDPSPYFFGALLYNVVIASALAWILWLFALQYLDAAMAGLAALGVPLVSVFSSWLQLGEQPGGFELAGMALIVGALAVISLGALGKAK